MKIQEKKVKIVIDQEIAELIPGYLEHRKQDILEIKKLLEQEDYAKIKNMGHSLRGSAGLYGFDEIIRIATGIEHFAEGNDASNIYQQLEKLRAYLDSLEIVYE